MIGSAHCDGSPKGQSQGSPCAVIRQSKRAVTKAVHAQSLDSPKEQSQSSPHDRATDRVHTKHTIPCPKYMVVKKT